MKNPDTLVADYQTAAGADVLLTVLVGNAQMGATAVWINEKLHGQQVYNRTKVGTDAQLVGKEVRVKTIVADINSFTNKMAVTYTLEGGATSLIKTTSFEVDTDGLSAIFRGIFTIKL